MKNNIFKNPSYADLDFIEEIVTKYKLEDKFLVYLNADAKKMIGEASSVKQRGIYKSLYKEFFPYTQKLWEEIFLIINNKIPLNLVAEDFEKRSGLPADVCEAIAQDIINNPTIQKEISAIQIEEDIPQYEDFETFPETEKELQEMRDEKVVAEIEKNITNNGTNTRKEESGGLGQELF
ncbi:MAG: hypothetical protein PHR47_03465 [Candidatus Pacebacteria bacterium]|nr:hypothetical protein [Candidatus Paceibacterota bacterium]